MLLEHSEHEQGATRLRVGFETLGCRSNFADTMDIQAALKERNVETCSFRENADVYVINTCTVTDAADREALRLIRRVRRNSPSARIVVTGCMAETGRETLEGTGMVDSVIGPGNRSAVVAAILGTEDRSAGENARRRSEITKRSVSLNTPLSKHIGAPGERVGSLRNRARFHLRIQEGCENACTFCIIPFSRGRLSSKAITQILDDIDELAELGYEEVILTGTHLGGYGLDLDSHLLSLLEAITLHRPRPRLRLSSIDPNDLSVEIIRVLATSDIFCKHLHICVQAFDDQILKRMNRRYRMADVQDIVRVITEYLPDCCLGTDLITGFPGETREQLEEQMAIYETLPFSYLHVFPYSERTLTAATRFGGVVEGGERKRRAARWRALSERKLRSFMLQFVGRPVEIVVEQIEDELVLGTTGEFLLAGFPRSAVGGVRVGERLRGRVVSYDERRSSLVCAC